MPQIEKYRISAAPPGATATRRGGQSSRRASRVGRLLSAHSTISLAYPAVRDFGSGSKAGVLAARTARSVVLTCDSLLMSGRPTGAGRSVRLLLEEFDRRLDGDLPPLPSRKARTQRTGLDANFASIFALFFGYRPTRARRHAPSGKGGKMPAKRTILLAAGSLLTACLSNVDPGNRALAQEPPSRQPTLREIYRDRSDIELQNKIAPFKVFDNLY